jgi:hypothetical protein
MAQVEQAMIALRTGDPAASRSKPSICSALESRRYRKLRQIKQISTQTEGHGSTLAANP